MAILEKSRESSSQKNDRQKLLAAFSSHFLHTHNMNKVLVKRNLTSQVLFLLVITKRSISDVGLVEYIDREFHTPTKRIQGIQFVFRIYFWAFENSSSSKSFGVFFVLKYLSKESLYLYICLLFS